MSDQVSETNEQQRIVICADSNALAIDTRNLIDKIHAHSKVQIVTGAVRVINIANTVMTECVLNENDSRMKFLKKKKKGGYKKYT